MLRTAIDRTRTTRNTDESGFTLIELLIVIVILGVLAGIVVFSVKGITKRGVEAACKSDVSTVQTASEAYYAKNGTYPTAIDGAATTTLVGGGFLRSAPSNSQYVVSIDSAGGVSAAPACSTLN